MSTTAEAAASRARPARPRAEVLRRADGIELIGEFEDSGFKRPPLLARRADGQVVQLTELLYAVAAAADGRSDVHAIAGAVSERCGRTVSADNVRVLAEAKLRPLGVLALADGTSPPLAKHEPLMALRHRRPLLSERGVNAGARLFTWLHLPVVTIPLVLALLAFDVWLFGVHGIAGGLRSALYDPVLLLAVFASVVVATAFHEFGHASACRYGGARPGVMGVGLYLVWPAFYCDITDAYRLSRRGRLRTDLGGVYFNAIFALLCGGVFFVTGEEAALLAAVVQHVLALQQLLPLLRFDGYYVLTDLTGVPDILSRIKPIFRSLVPGRASEPRVEELKPWVRFAVTAYLLTLVPALILLFAWMMMGAPRIFATVYDSLGLQVDRLDDAGGPAEAAVGVLRIAMLVLPVAAMSLSLGRVSRMTGRGLVNWARGSVSRTAMAVACAASLIGTVAYIWWPNGDYEPIRPGERGTIGEALAATPAAASGRPSFTPERELQFGSEPTGREEEAARRTRDRGERRGTRDGEAQDGAAEPSDGADEADGDETWFLEDEAPSSDAPSTTTSPSTTSTSPAPASGETGSPGTTTSTGEAAPAPAPTTTSGTSESGTTGSSTTDSGTTDSGTSGSTDSATAGTTTTDPVAPRTTTETIPDATSVVPPTTTPSPETTTTAPAP